MTVRTHLFSGSRNPYEPTPAGLGCPRHLSEAHSPDKEGVAPRALYPCNQVNCQSDCYDRNPKALEEPRQNLTWLLNPDRPEGLAGTEHPWKYSGLETNRKDQRTEVALREPSKKERNFSSVIHRKRRRRSWARKSCVKSLPDGIDMAALGLESAGSSFLGTRTLN